MSMPFAEADALYEDLLMEGNEETLAWIRETAYKRGLSRVMVLVEYGDPRKDDSNEEPGA